MKKNENNLQKIAEGLESKKYRIRKLTERECFRLMGVDDFTIDTIQNARFSREGVVPVQDGAEKLSKSRQYKMAGNSIVVDCMYYIFRNLFIGEPEEEKTTLF